MLSAIHIIYIGTGAIARAAAHSAPTLPTNRPPSHTAKRQNLQLDENRKFRTIVRLASENAILSEFTPGDSVASSAHRHYHAPLPGTPLPHSGVYKKNNEEPPVMMILHYMHFTRPKKYYFLAASNDALRNSFIAFSIASEDLRARVPAALFPFSTCAVASLRNSA